MYHFVRPRDLTVEHHPLCPVCEDAQVDVVALANVGEGVGGLGVPAVEERPCIVLDDVGDRVLGVRIVCRFDGDRLLFHDGHELVGINAVGLRPALVLPRGGDTLIGTVERRARR